MGRKDDAKRKNKGISAEKATSSRHQQPPVRSNSDTPPASPENAYPFTARMRMTSSMKERETKLKDLKVLNALYPDIELLENLGIWDELASYFVKNGLGFVFAENPPLVYEMLVREFIYSFVPEWRVRHTYEGVEKQVVSWKFRMGGVEYSFSRNDLLRALDLPNCTIYPRFSKSINNNVWRTITGMDSDFVPTQQETKIIDPLWRLVHRFIATCVILRKDEGRWVTKGDFELLCSFHDDVKIDLLTVITKSLEEPTIPTFRGTYLAGGPFVTMIAQHIGFALDPQFAMPFKTLNEEDFIRRGFVKIKRTRSGVSRLLIGRDTPKINTSQPPSSHDVAGPSSVPQQPITMEDLSAQLHTLTTYTYEGFRWAGEMFDGLYTRMGYDGYVPPPPHPYRTTDMGTSHNEGNDEEEDDDGDDMDEDTEDSSTF